MNPPASAEITIQFHDALAKGLRGGGLKVIPSNTVRDKLKLGVENAGCDEGACLQTAHGLIPAQRYATLRVESVGKNYTVEVRLFKENRLQAKSIGRCDICTFFEALQTVEHTASEVGTKGEEPPDSPPIEKPASPLPDPPTKPKTEPEMAPTAGPPANNTAPAKIESPPRQWPLWPGIVAGGIGVLAVAVGAPLIAINGNGTNCVGDPLPDKTNCQDLYKTGTAGWVFAGMGVGALVASGVLFYLHFSSKPKEEARAS